MLGKITEEQLAVNGYRKHGKSHFKEHSDFLYQKCIRDKKGKRYYINFFHYPPHKGVIPDSYTVNLQIDANVSYIFEMFSLNNKSIAFVEKKCKLFWDKIANKKYYELF